MREMLADFVEHPVRRARALVGVIVTAFAVAAWPAAASAAITIGNATLEGVASTSAPPGSVISATITANVSSGTWSATKVRFGSGTSECINHDNQSSGFANKHVSFDVTAPGEPGNYSVAFQPYDSGSCTGSGGTTFTLVNGLRVTTPVPNRDLPPRCGITLMLVLDESGSIGSSAENVRNATRAFLNALSGTGAKVGIIDFSSSAALQVPYTT